MAQGKMTTYILNERPVGDIVPGKTFRKEIVDLPTEDDLAEGQILVEVNYVSIDPAMRNWMRDRRSYIAPVQVGDVMRSHNVGTVLASKSPLFKPGDRAIGMMGWRERAILDTTKNEVFPLAKIPGYPLANQFGLLGACLTPYFGLREIGKPQPGELVVVSGAAGATGLLVGQMCKNKGCRVVGIAGTDDKCKYLTDEIGFDVALNYKAADFEDKFIEATKDHIDVYWDNVGGRILDLAMLQAKEHARFVMCGRISAYNKEGPESFENFSKVGNMRIRMEGMVVTDYTKDFMIAGQEVASMGLKMPIHVVKGGLEEAEGALIDIFRGVNIGKMLVEVKPVEE